MTTKSQIIETLKAQYPTLQTGSEETGYEIMSETEYEQTISEWADAQITKEKAEADALAERNLKISAYQKLGLSEAEIEALLPTPQPRNTELLGGN